MPTAKHPIDNRINKLANVFLMIDAVVDQENRRMSTRWAGYGKKNKSDICFKDLLHLVLIYKLCNWSFDKRGNIFEYDAVKEKFTLSGIPDFDKTMKRLKFFGFIVLHPRSKSNGATGKKVHVFNLTQVTIDVLNQIGEGYNQVLRGRDWRVIIKP